MSAEQADLLNLRQAWRRVKRDLSNLLFIEYPNEVALVESDLSEWLNQLDADIREDRYEPGMQLVVDIPKARGALRPGSHLSMRDCVVYYATVGACFPQLEETLAWARKVDFSHQLSPDRGRDKWITNEFIGWTAFRERSLNRLDEGYTYVVDADIAAFYENVDIATLMSDLRGVHIPEPAAVLLSRCLNKWPLIGGRGLTQGQSPSDILAKLYLDSVDHNLQALGYLHYRYVDDIRIFCRSLPEARKALMQLTQLLQRRGLQLATEKLEIFRADEARTKISGIAPIIQTVQSNLVEQLVAVLELDSPYLEIWEVDQIVSENPDEAPLDLIRQTYQSYFIDTTDRFNKTLFRYLLKRLGSANDDMAVENCKIQFERNPQETRAILRYIAAAAAVGAFEDYLVAFLASDRAVYPYQVYQVLKWYASLGLEPSPALLGIARDKAFDETAPEYVRAAARHLIARFGVPADLERLQAAYETAGSELERAELICAVSRMERGRRNAFIARVENDGALQARAARLVRAGAV